jgi:hypothetical protein
MIAYESPAIVRASQGQSVPWAARHYLNLFISAIPCRKDKTPAIASWRKYQQVRASYQQAYQWESDGLWESVGIVCGAVSQNLVVIDLDGQEAIDLWRREQPHLCDTYTVRSGSGKGAHLYFYVRDLPPTTRVVGIDAGNIELRANGCYVIAPPSVHPSGGLYTVECPRPIAVQESMAGVVTWIKGLIRQKHGGVMPPPSLPAGTIRRASAYGLAALNDECAKVRTARTGVNNQLNLSAFKLGRLVKRGAIDMAQVESALYQAAYANGYVERDGERQTRATIASGLNAGIAKG